MVWCLLVEGRRRVIGVTAGFLLPQKRLALRRKLLSLGLVHLLTLSAPLAYTSPTGDPSSLEPGSYLVEDRNAWELAYLSTPGTARVNTVVGTDILSAGCAPGRVLLIRPGGLGALMFVGCVVREIKHRWPESVVAVSCAPGGAEVFRGMPYPDAIEPYPLPADRLKEYDVVIPLEGATEYGPDATRLHAADAFARAAGIELPEADAARVPAFCVSELEREAILLRYPRSARPRLALQVFGSAAARSYPLDLTKQLVGKLTGRGWEVMLLGLPGTVPGENSREDLSMGVINCAHDRLSFRESAAVVATSDAVLAPDSVWTHVAGALGLPAVALYGSESWMLRTRFYRRTFALTSGKCPLAPCHHWPKNPMHYPENGPCAKTGQCEEMRWNGGTESREVPAGEGKTRIVQVPGVGRIFAAVERLRP